VPERILGSLDRRRVLVVAIFVPPGGAKLDPREHELRIDRCRPLQKSDGVLDVARLSIEQGRAFGIREQRGAVCRRHLRHAIPLVAVEPDRPRVFEFATEPEQ
jgi:hypothetical protein